MVDHWWSIKLDCLHLPKAALFLIFVCQLYLYQLYLTWTLWKQNSKLHHYDAAVLGQQDFQKLEMATNSIQLNKNVYFL